MSNLRHDIRRVLGQEQEGLGDLGGARQRLIHNAMASREVPHQRFWIAGAAAAILAALLIGVLLVARPHSRSVPANPRVASPARTDSCAVTNDAVPIPRNNAGMVYDAKHGYVLMFGGADPTYSSCTRPGWVKPSGGNVAVTNETWKWDGMRWTLLRPTKAPSARTVTTMAYDPSSQRVILLNGGLPNSDPSHEDMWAWDGTTWIELKPATIPPWCPQNAITDRNLSVVQLIACTPTKQPDPSHIWEWSGSDWTYVAIRGVAPPARFGFVFAYDPEHRQAVFAAGCTSESAPSGCIGDTWLLANHAWLQSPSRIASSAGPHAAYDEMRHQLVHVAVGESSVETWTWDGNVWTLHKSRHPAPSAGPIAYDPTSRQVITFGGQRGSEQLSETWGWNGEDWIQLG